ncbi:MAG: hypothetical protein EOP61_12240 [Sphingomonadales bacterium]|nr:MAG: hypothetical protein EOP61_12240 [Sphingomonadales bacterium]
MFALLTLLAAQDIQPPRIDPCAQYIGLGYTVGFRPSVPRQGDTVELIPMFVQSHGMPVTPVPPECASDWKIEGEGVKLEHGRLRIGADAVPGAEVKFSAQIGGTGGGRGYGSLKIIGATQKVLAGKFSITAQERCETPRIAEMTFSARGQFTYTMPDDMFETKVTGSGSYRWDGDTGRLELGGDEQPFKARWTGTAKWVDGSLVLEGIDLGGWSDSCRITLAGG